MGEKSGGASGIRVTENRSPPNPVRGLIRITGSHVGATVEELGMCVKDVLTNEVAEYSSHDHVCRKMLQAS